MKKITYILLAFAVSLLIFSCQKSDDLQPEIKYIRAALSEASDSLLTEAAMGSVVAIIGENLADVQKVVFNDQVAQLNPTMISNTSILVTVPGNMPTEVTNTVTLTTGGGKSCQYDFAVIIPSPQVTSIDCEWTAAGSAVTIYGNYFFPREDGTVEVMFPGNVAVNTSVTDITEVTCIVPEGALPGTIKITSAYGYGRSTFTFRNSEGMFIDMENPGSWNGWGKSTFGTQDAINGTYFDLNLTGGSWAWPSDASMIFFINPSAAPIVTEGYPSDYSLVFEYWCKTWTDTPMLFWFTDTPDTFDVDGADAQWHWKPYKDAGGEFHTDGWQTMTVPLSEFNTSKDETETRSIPSVNSLTNMCAMFFGAADVSAPIQIWMCNFRIVKNK